jgi:proline iminopeptidase
MTVTNAGRLVDAADTRLYVEEHGDPSAPALLYLHGGPGMGCAGFVAWQAERLGGALRLIAFDQRGAARSAPLTANTSLDEDVLVADCEALRVALGIDRWSVLGHSFGARLALRYALRHPDRLHAALFECPVWDVAETERYRAPFLSAMLEQRGDRAAAAVLRAFVARCDAFADGYPIRYHTWRAAAGPWYLYDQSRVDEMRAAAARDLPEIAQRNTAYHFQALQRPGSMFFESLLPLLPELRVPALVIRGAADLVMTPRQLSAFRVTLPHGTAVEVPEAGHFVQFEQPDRYAELVTAYVLAAASGELPAR